jgi:uncharacterized protein YuzE
LKLTIDADREHDQLYISFAKNAARASRVARTTRVNDDIVLDFDAGGHLIGIDIMNASKVIGSRIGDFRLDELVGVKEAAQLAGVHASNFVRDYASEPGFPRPAIGLASGRIWLRSQVEQYLSSRRKRSRRAS